MVEGHAGKRKLEVDRIAVKIRPSHARRAPSGSAINSCVCSTVNKPHKEDMNVNVPNGKWKWLTDTVRAAGFKSYTPHLFTLQDFLANKLTRTHPYCPLDVVVTPICRAALPAFRSLITLFCA